MNGDFARITFDSEKRFSRVLLQQGRMLLEADYNEQSAIHHYFLRTLITDLVGRCWRAGDAFTLSEPKEKDDFQIKAGHFYVDGIMCENGLGCSYLTQPYGPVPVQAPSGDGFMAYIECWERHVSAVQVAELREIALGGRDTATRAQIVWQARVASVDWAKSQAHDLSAALDAQVNHPVDADSKAAAKAAKDKVTEAYKGFIAAIGKIGAAGADAANCTAAQAFVDVLDLAAPRLRARAKLEGQSDPCAIAADSQYRGRENQLYRIEVHAAGAAGRATFKWSRENASVAFRVADQGITAKDDIVTVELESLGHDRRTGLCEGDWVEITGDAFEFGAMAAPLGQVTKIDRGRRSVTLRVGVDPKTPVDFASCTLLRRWDETAGVNTSGTIDIVEGLSEADWIPIERGIKIQFVPGGLYRTGDYWVVPARVASGDIVWPQVGKDAKAIPPDGVERHRAAIGFGKQAGGNWTYSAPCGCTRQPLCP